MPARPAIAALICAAVVALFLCPVPPRAPLTPFRLIAYALLYLLVTAGAAIIGARLARGASIRLSRIAAMVVWLAPLAIATVEKSMLAVAAAVMFLATCLSERRPRPDDTSSGFRFDMFAMADSVPLVRQLPSAICLGFLLQAAAATIFAERVLFSVIFSTAATALLWLCLHRAGIGNRRWPAWLTIALALAVTIAGLSRYLPETAGAAETSANPAASDPTPGVDVGGDYSGVILIPEAEKNVLLVPPLPSMSPQLFTAKQHQPLKIPFYGVYWFFQLPHRRPPLNSAVIDGAPDTRSFRSAGRIPLIMEAHQNLGRLVDISCCSEIRVAIRNADRFPATLAIELMLVNTSVADKPFASLGMQPVRSIASAGEVLVYRMPFDPGIESFDEITLRFHSARVREDRSARIAIENFVLTPRER